MLLTTPAPRRAGKRLLRAGIAILSNLLGLSLGVDLNPAALKLPGVGRIGSNPSD